LNIKNPGLFRSSRLTGIAGLLLTLSFPAVSHAGLLFGTFSIAPSANETVDISTGDINFMPSGAFTINSATGSFSALGGTGVILSIDDPPYAVNTFYSTPDFLTFAGNGSITFTLQILDAGVEGTADCNLAPAAGQNCTPDVPGLAPYNLTNTSSTTSAASFDITGLEVDSSTNTTVPFIGVVAAQFSVPYQTLLGDVDDGQTIVTTYSATFSTIPEPGTGGMLALGALGIGIFSLLRFRRRSASVR